MNGSIRKRSGGLKAGTQVQYKVFAEDSFGNSAVTGVQTYVVQSQTQTPTTGATSTTETGRTTTLRSSMDLDPTFIAIGLAGVGGILAVIVVYVIRRK